MKTILVPIDHTAAAEHTLAYANKLAVRWPAEVVLLYCHQVEATTNEPAAVLLAQEQRLRGLVERLRYQQLTRQNGRRIQYRYRVLAGCLHDHVQAVAAACLGLWDDVMVMDLKHFDGSLSPIDRVPQEIKQLYATAFEVETRWLVEAAARRQKWIDQAQSLNIYMAGASGKKLDETYKLAWLRGLKTTYYLRTMSATHAEKSTVTAGRMNAVSSGNDAQGSTKMSSALEAAAAAAHAQMELSSNAATDIKFCGVDDPTCESCQ